MTVPERRIQEDSLLPSEIGFVKKDSGYLFHRPILMHPFQ